MKKVIYLFITILTIWMAQGCQTDDEARATGEVKVSILADPSLSTTRAQMTPAQAIDLDVIDENQTVVKSFKDAAATGVGTFALPVGTYVFHAYSANKNSSTPYFDADNAYYEDSDTVVVTAGSMQDVSLVCTLAMSKVSVNYSDALKTNFTQLDCTVSGPAGSLLYNKEETRAGYFPASGTLLITLNVTNVKGNSFSTQQEITDIAPRTHYRLNFSLADDDTGSGQFTITFDPTTNDYVFNVGVPLTSPYEVELLEPDVYGKTAYLYARSGKDDNTGLTFQYRLKGTEDWVNATTTEQQVDGLNTFVGLVNNLDFGTSYEYRMAVNNSDMSITDVFTTESYIAIPNLDMNSWYTSGRVVYPYAQGCTNPWWITGNAGATTGGGDSNSVSDTGRSGAEGDLCAKLETVKVTVAVITTYAAGNLYIGTFDSSKVGSGTSACTVFGHSYDNGARPQKLKGYYKYAAKDINVNADTAGEQDRGDIYIKLWKSEDTTDANLIAEGHFYPQGQVSEFAPFEIPLTYLSKEKAKYLTIVCTSSEHGGEFNGLSLTGKVGVGSTLWVDDLELIY
jgi:hypothetical protein